MGICGAIRWNIDLRLFCRETVSISRNSANGVVNVLAETSPLTPSIIRGVGRSKFSFAISLAIVAIAAALLYHLLRGIDDRQRHRRHQGTAALEDPARRRAGRRRLFQSRALRRVRAAHDRQALHAVAGRRLRKLHELHDRPLARCGDFHLRPGAVSRLFVLGPDRHRHRQDRVHDRPHLLAGQCLRARRRRFRHAGRARRLRSSAVLCSIACSDSAD